MSKFSPQSQRGFWYRVVEFILRPILKAATARDWRGGEHLRVDQGIVVAMNHLSWFDPFVAAKVAAPAAVVSFSGVMSLNAPPTVFWM